MRLSSLSKSTLVIALLMVAACAAGPDNTAGAEQGTSAKRKEITASSAEGSERSMRMAERAIAEGKPEMAAMLYRSAALADPQNPRPRIASASLFEKSGEYGAAAGLYEQLAKELADNSYWLDAGRNFLKANQAANAARAYQEALNKDVNDVRALNGLAVSHDLRQNHATAAGLYEKAHDLADRDLKNGILTNWALSLMLAGEAGQAVQKLEPAYAEHETAGLKQVLAIAYGLVGRVDDAKKLGLANPPTYEDLRATVRAFGMGGPSSGVTPAAAPVADVVSVPGKAP